MPWERFGSCRNYSDPLTISTQKRRSGGALANLVASKRIDAGYSVFAYTFASPGTTTYANATADRYKSIFNIINEDDLVPQLPLSSWGFTRYGQVVSGSIENSYASAWDELTGKTYAHAETAQTQVLTKLSAVSNDRNACYVYPSYSSSSVIRSTESYYNSYQAHAAATTFTAQYPAVCDDTYRIMHDGSGITYHYYVEYQPAMLLMLMANAMIQPNWFYQAPFAAYSLPTYLDTPRDKLVAYSLSNSCNAIKYPHYLESYYILTTNLS